MLFFWGKRKKARLASRFRCFHNGIILIVNCFKNLCGKYKLYFEIIKNIFNFVEIYVKILS